MILFLPGTLLASYLFERFGLRGGMLVGNVVNLLGSILRLSSIKANSQSVQHGYLLLLLGQALCGLVQPVYVNASALLAATWFPVEQRDLATVIASMSNPVGTGVGQILPSSLVAKNGAGMFLLLLIQCAISALSTVVVLIFFRNRPPTPPSFTETMRSRRHVPPDDAHNTTTTPIIGGQTGSARISLREQMVQVLSNREFLKLCIGFSVGLAYFNSLVTVLGQQVEILGYNDDAAGAYGALILGCGLLGCAVVGPIMDITHRYRTMLRILAILFAINVMALCFCLRPNKAIILGVLFGTLGSLVLPLLPLSFECAVECTYPVPESITNGFMLSLGNTLSIASTFLWQALIEATGKYRGVFVSYNYLQIGMLGFGMAFLLSFNGEYRRLITEKSQTVVDRAESDTKASNVNDYKHLWNGDNVTGAMRATSSVESI